jgi:Transcriptional regulator, contains sigma factor-related N-terminal domain
MGHDEIAKAMGIKRWTVGRLLNEARETGVVEVRIRNPLSRRYELEIELKTVFGLQDAVVVDQQHDLADTFRSVAMAAAEYLVSRSPSPKILGVSWGRTLAAVAQALPHDWHPEPDMTVTLVNGGVSQSTSRTCAGGVLDAFGGHTKKPVATIPTPAIVSSASLARSLRQEPVVANALEEARHADTLIYPLGVLSSNSVLVESGCMDVKDVSRLKAHGAVGDVLGHFLNESGQVAVANFDQRAIGLSLDDIRRLPTSIAVATGSSRLPMVRGVLQAKLCTVLVTDSNIASKILGNR